MQPTDKLSKEHEEWQAVMTKVIEMQKLVKTSVRDMHEQPWLGCYGSEGLALRVSRV